MSHLDLRALRVWPGARRPGLPKAEAGADAGLAEDKHAHYLLPALGSQPGLYAALDALDWENTPVAAATSEISRGRIETRTICATKRSAILPVQRAEMRGGISGSDG